MQAPLPRPHRKVERIDGARLCVGGAAIREAVDHEQLAILLQAILTCGVALIVGPLVVFFRDLERAVKLILRFLFYASPIIYGVSNLPEELHVWAAFNPLSGIFGLYRAGFFPDELDWFNVVISAAMSLVLLAIGLLVFRGSVRQVLKEI